jgi:hypothetical protein
MPKTEDKRSKDEREVHRVEIAQLYLKGNTQAAIAEKLDISQQQVSYDLKVIRKRWLESSVRDFDELKSNELAKIDLLEAEAWKAWERSIGTKKIVSKKKGVNGKGPIDETTTRVEELAGNPAFLTAVNNCIDRRCRILGLETVLKFEDLNLAITRVLDAGYTIYAQPEQKVEERSDRVSNEG